MASSTNLNLEKQFNNYIEVTLDSTITNGTRVRFTNNYTPSNGGSLQKWTITDKKWAYGTPSFNGTYGLYLGVNYNLLFYVSVKLSPAMSGLEVRGAWLSESITTYSVINGTNIEFISGGNTCIGNYLYDINTTRSGNGYTNGASSPTSFFNCIVTIYA